MASEFYFGFKGPNLSVHREFQIADEDAPHILVYLMGGPYGTVTENVKSEVPDASWSPAEGETEKDRPTIEVQEWVTRPATPEEAADNYARARFSELVNATNEDRKAKAAAAAAAAVKPIEPV